MALLAVAGVVAVSAGVAFHRFNRRFVDAALSAADARLATHRDRFMQDQARLAGLPFLAPRQGGRDAGPVIGPHVRLDLVTLDGMRSRPPVPGSAVDPDAIAKLGKDPTHAPPELWNALDFTWMSQLSGYDHWDVDEAGFADDPAAYRDPDPLITDLLVWGELRIAKGVHQGDVASAVTDVEELARLCFTTERLGGALAGIGLLAFIHRRVPVPASLRPGVSPDDLAAIQRVTWASLAFARLESPTTYEGDFGGIAVGRCAALHDGLWLAHHLRPDLGEVRGSDYARLERLLAGSPGCRLRVLRARWAHPPDPRRAKPPGVLDRVEGWIPAMRRLRGETLLAIGAQDWFRAYEEPPREPGQTPR